MSYYPSIRKLTDVYLLAEAERIEQEADKLPECVLPSHYEKSKELLTRTIEIQNEITRRTMPAVVSALAQGVVIDTDLEPEQ